MLRPNKIHLELLSHNVSRQHGAAIEKSIQIM